MSLTVLSVAYPFAPVGPDATGGAEQVLSLLDGGLVRRGHRSIVVACAGSSASGRLVETPAVTGPIDDAVRAAGQRRTAGAIAEALERERVDVVHLHGVDFHRYLPDWPGPVLVTLHLPPSFYPPSALRDIPPNLTLACVSESQRRACPRGAAVRATIENGVLVGRLAGGPLGRQEFVAALGRICPEKGFHLALDAARSARVGCRLAGRLFPYDAHVRYFEREIVPRLDPERVFVGPLGFRGKRRLLREARGLLVPSLAPETSSLVAMEALACGTPVVAFRAGALPEIVEHGRTGFLVDRVDEMSAAIAELHAIDPAVCRATARERFSAEAMIERYVSLYRALARERRTSAA